MTAILGLALSACAQPGTPPVCTAPLKAAVAIDLYFGRDKPGGGEVTDAEWGAFVTEIVTSRFPDGLSVFDSSGQYREPNGRIVRERSKRLVVIVFDSDVTTKPSVQDALLRLKSEIEGRLRESAAKTGSAAWLGVFLFTLLMISREGMETALLMGTLVTQVQAMSIIGGAIAGTLAAAGVAMMWSRYGHRVNLALFFQVTAIFLLVFVAQLLIYGFHELTEANLFPGSEALHWATEPYGPDGVYGQYLTYMLVAMPLTWLLFAMITGTGQPPARSAAQGRAA